MISGTIRNIQFIQTVGLSCRTDSRLFLCAGKSIYSMTNDPPDGSATNRTERTSSSQDCTRNPANRRANSSILLAS
jgi:hypothetical protein